MRYFKLCIDIIALITIITIENNIEPFNFSYYAGLTLFWEFFKETSLIIAFTASLVWFVPIRIVDLMDHITDKEQAEFSRILYGDKSAFQDKLETIQKESQQEVDRLLITRWHKLHESASAYGYNFLTLFNREDYEIKDLFGWMIQYSEKNELMISHECGERIYSIYSHIFDELCTHDHLILKTRKNEIESLLQHLSKKLIDKYEEYLKSEDQDFTHSLRALNQFISLRSI